MTPRRLLVFTENHARGGGNRYCVDLINALAPSYDEVILAANDGGIFPEDEARLAANVVVRPASFATRSRARHALERVPRLLRAPLLLLLSIADPVLFGLNVWLLSRLVRRVMPSSVLSCNGGYPAARATLSMVVAARRCGVPAALSIVSMPASRSEGTALYDRLIDRMVWRSCKLVIVNANAIADALACTHDLPTGLARTLYNGLPDAPTHAPAAPPESIGFVARLDRAKGVLVLLEAFARLAPRWPALRLLLVGRGNASQAVAERARALGIEDRVDARGFDDGDILALLNSFRVYAFPSFHEGLPYSILEAMRAGCPIVSTAVGGIPEVLDDGRDALLVPPDDVESLATAIERLLADTSEARRLGRAARERFERDHLLDRCAARARLAFTEAGMLDRIPVLPSTAIAMDT